MKKTTLLQKNHIWILASQEKHEWLINIGKGAQTHKKSGKLKLKPQ